MLLKKYGEKYDKEKANDTYNGENYTSILQFNYPGFSISRVFKQNPTSKQYLFKSDSLFVHI